RNRTKPVPKLASSFRKQAKRFPKPATSCLKEGKPIRKPGKRFPHPQCSTSHVNVVSRVHYIQPQVHNFPARNLRVARQSLGVLSNHHGLSRQKHRLQRQER